MLVSIVIANYNYGKFIGDAIDSALALDWPTVEVIVIDDGSTDDSQAVIRSYGNRVMAVFQPNSGQRAAHNAGFARARGEVILFLDSDDTIDSSVVAELAAVWRPGISRVQFQMKIIDAKGKPTGAFLPQFWTIPTPEQVRHWMLTTADYPGPPGSGAAYSRTFLEKIFPLPEGDGFSDSYAITAAPLLGDVLTVAKPLVSYRIHGRNLGALSSLDVSRLGREVARARFRFQYGQTIAKSVGMRLPDAAFDRNLTVLPYRLASVCLAPQNHPIGGDSARRVLVHLIRAAFGSPQGAPVTARFALVLWGTLVAVSPQPIRGRVVLWRFSSSSRPQALRRVLKVLGVVR